MPIRGLESLDGVLLDGLEFCTRVYAAFDQIRNAPGGIEEIRIRKSTRAKKLIEELLPLSSYVQAQHGAALRIQIKWLGGNQSYDAHLTCSGNDVDRGVVPKSQFLEVTTATHANEYLIREQLHKTGATFAARSPHRNPTTRAIISEPSLYEHQELTTELLTQISDAISKKVQKKYPRPTSLLLRCVTHHVICDHDWSYLVQELRNRGGFLPFREVFLFESISRRLSTIHRRHPNNRFVERIATPFGPGAYFYHLRADPVLQAKYRQCFTEFKGYDIQIKP